MYKPVPGHVDLPALDHEVLDFWRRENTFDRTLRQSEGRPRWTFYEGPPTANGMPGTHHIEARVFKDIFPRYRTMKGYHVPRKAGWDCHGLPVELAVERELGFSGKRDIEAYGIAEFNARCRESVARHTDAFAELTHRMGYWVDLDQAYSTMAPEYIESVWWSLKQIFDRGLLVEDFRVTPWCPRDQTALSDHELAQGYEDDVSPSVFVRFPLLSGPLAGTTSLLIWTTTPWTLVSNTAVAVHPEVMYVVVTDGTERLVVAEPLVDQVVGGWRPTGESFTGVQMERWAYDRPFDLIEIPDSHVVINARYVTTDSGTGLVHQAPAFGADDLKSCRAYGLAMVNPLRPDGTFDPDIELVGGRFFRDADALLVESLHERELLFREMRYEHSYPHCWRCHTPLVYYAQPSWYVRTTEVRAELTRENERTNWYPETIKRGRFGDWLSHNVDWAVSRTRYWGTPLPIWRCPEQHLTCVGSLRELGELAGLDLSSLDPHRPFVDDVSFPCQCGQTATRVPEVIDAWYDSGSMPFAQFGYPHRDTGEFEESYPAQFICEAIDQTRGWFYTLMAVGTLVFDRSAYENVLCLGHILAEDGRKMSKHLGNTLEPIPLLEQHGADAVRWFMAASGSPWSARRVGHTTLREVVRKTLLTYWNVVAFQALYGRTAGWAPSQSDPPVVERPVLDRWVLSELNLLVSRVDAALDGFDTQEAGQLLSSFVDDLSNWYVRRGRRRFWRADPSALATLHEVLRTLTLLLAPLAPFITEKVWQDLVVPVEPSAAESVHMAAFPVANDDLVDERLNEHVALARRLVELGRTARAESGMKTRQPLARSIASAQGFTDLSAELVEEIAAELNVAQVLPMSATGESLVDTSAKANFRALGKRFGKAVQAVASAIAAADAKLLEGDLASGSARVIVDGEQVEIGPDEVIITQTPREGWAVASEPGATIAFDLHLTPELRRAGLAREAVRLIQEARKSSGLEVTDRIVLRYEAREPTLAAALEENGALVATEVLAVKMATGRPEAAMTPYVEDDLGLTFWVQKA